MDPLSALSLAGTIVGFVDFSCKLISETRDVYKSGTGLPKDAIELRAIATDLKRMLDGLQISSTRGTTSAGFLLQSLAFDCKATADELLGAIEKLTNDSPDSKWKSFMIALKHVLRPGEAQKIANGVAKLQRQVGLQMLTLMSEQQYGLTIKLGEIEDNDRKLGMARTVQFQQLKGDLLGALDSLQTQKNLQHDTIKAHLKKMSAMQSCTQIDVLALSHRMETLQSALEAFAQETQDIAVEQTVLQSLAYDEAHQRGERVSEAHADTFGWIFDQEFSAGPTPSQTFAEWLQSDGGLCWIAGKPGSGKSTLMKHILNNDRTCQELRKWSAKSQHDLCIGSYFFWIAGTPLQKSQKGLLRCLLYDVFRQAPKAISLVCNEKRLATSNPYRSIDRSVSNYGVEIREPWTNTELYATFSALADRRDISKKYCFFIDGLDEYKLPDEGDYDDLIRLLQRFSTSSNFKFCVASREENEFRDYYLDVNHFILQQLTKTDVENYVHELLNESTHFRRLSSEDHAYLDLEEEIVHRAQGVFLWVSLVVKTLIDGMRNSDTIADLQRELENLPDSLEKYFTRIIESIEPRYRIPAAKILQVANQAETPLQLLDYYFLDHEATRQEGLDGWTSLSNAEIDRFHEDARRRLAARCKGLLEVVKVDEKRAQNSPYFKFNVQYLHRTTRDFLHETTEMQTFFENLLPKGYIAQREICAAFLRLMENIPLCPCGCDEKAEGGRDHFPAFDSILRSFLRYAEYMWKIRSDPQIELVREAEKVVLQRPKQWRRSKPTGFVGLAVEFGLAEYVRLRIEESPALLHAKSRSLLEYALILGGTQFSSDASQFWMFGIESESKQRLPMIEMLLRLGAPVERRLWRPLLLASHKCQLKATRSSKRDVVTVFALFVEHGANLQEQVVINHEIKRRTETGLSADLLKKTEVRIEEKKSAIDIIRSTFTPEEVATILRHQPVKKSKSWRSWLGWKHT